MGQTVIEGTTKGVRPTDFKYIIGGGQKGAAMR